MRPSRPKKRSIFRLILEMNSAPVHPQSTLNFWFEELTAKQHFVKDAALDEAIRGRFGGTLKVVARRELFAWRHRQSQATKISQQTKQGKQ
jgi:uncharacterized protein (DUF924 family)